MTDFNMHRVNGKTHKIECEWKRDVNGFAREKVVRHVELFDKPSHGSQDSVSKRAVA